MDIQKIISQLRGFTPKIDQAADTAVGQAKNAYGKFNQLKQVATAPSRAMKAVVDEFSYSPTTIPKDWRYRTSTLSNKALRNLPNLTQIPYSDTPDWSEDLYDKSNPKQRLAIEGMWGDNLYNRVKSPSADYNRYNFQAPPMDARGKELAKTMINNTGLYPGAKRYLENIPVKGADFGKDSPFAGYYQGGPVGEPYVGYSTNNPEGFDKEVVSHELMHAADQVLGKDELKTFVVDVNKAYQSNPEYFQPVMDWIKGYKQSMKDRKINYFSDPAAEAAELFAGIGALYGPEMSNHPILGKYYSRVFDPNTQYAQPQSHEKIYYEDGSSGIVPPMRLNYRNGQ